MCDGQPVKPIQTQCFSLKCFLVKHTSQVNCDCVVVQRVNFNIILFVWNAPAPPTRCLLYISFSYHLNLNWCVIIHGSQRMGSNADCQWCAVNCVFERNLVLYIIKYALKPWKSQRWFSCHPFLCENCFSNREQSCKSDVLLPLISVEQFDQKRQYWWGALLVLVSSTLLPKGLFSLWHLNSLKRWVNDKELWIPYIYLLLLLKKLIEDRELWGVKGCMGQDFSS